MSSDIRSVVMTEEVNNDIINEILEEIKNMYADINDELVELIGQRDAAKSSHLRGIIDRIIILSYSIEVSVAESIGFWSDCVKNNRNSEHLIVDGASEWIEKSVKMLNEIESEDLKKLGAKEVCAIFKARSGMYSNLVSVNTLEEILWLQSLYFSVSGTYLALVLNDYDKKERVKESVSSMINTAFGACPLTTIQTTAYNSFVAIINLADTLDGSVLKEEFFSDADKKFCILEKQVEVLEQLYTAQDCIYAELKAQSTSTYGVSNIDSDTN